MRLLLLILLLVTFASSFVGAAPQAEGEAAEGKAPAPPPRISRSGGVVTIRGTTSQTPNPASEPTAKTEPAEEAPKKEAAKADAPKPPRRVRSANLSVDAYGRPRRDAGSTVVQRDGDNSSSTLTIQNSNGRRVPYITEDTKQISASARKKVSERRTQRYDTRGRPSRQDLVRIEERKLPNGAVQRTETLYSENMNGRMEMVERSVEVVEENGPVTKTTKKTEKPSINGRLETILREESTERKEGESKATRETVKSANFGGRMQVVAREESVMTKSGDIAKTETRVFERQPASGEIELSSRSVGTLEERPDGTSVERVETYGFRMAGGAINVNTSRPTLQEVVERRTTVQADGAVRERVSVRGLSAAAPGEMGPPKITETVTKPTADGEQVRTDHYEQGVNGRMRPTQSTVQQIEK